MKKDDIQKNRIWAVQRFFNGEKPSSICASLGRPRSWLYNWVKRYIDGDNSWSESLSRRPLNNPTRTPKEVEEIVKMLRLNLYNRDLFCGAQAIRWEMEDLGVKPLPSLRTINRILSRNGLTHRRTGIYQPKGKTYPKLPSLLTNQTHQADLVGPCYLKGPIRFYSLNAVDLATARCGLSPLRSKSGQSVINGFWDIWKRLGIPNNVQVDNAMTFFGSRRHPRGMGPLIRLCLNNGVEPWFIPVAEPWRNGVVEKFNDHYQQRFLGKITMTSEAELRTQSLAFEQRHNGTYRYSKLGGKTPLKALVASQKRLRFPQKEEVPRHPMKKPEVGRYHLVRFIRSNLKLNIFGELFRVPPELQYEYVVATINVKEQKLKLYLDKTQVEEFIYKLR
jgi:transposase InsO family protein